MRATPAGGSVAAEQDLGTTFDMEARKELPLSDDVDVNRYVARVGQKIVAALGDQPFNYRFAVVRDGRINAFAVPGGSVYVNAGLLTAAGNDLAYEEVFVEQLRTFMEAGDVVVGISTSGRSRNILRAVEYANQRGAITFGITGADGGPLRAMTADSLSIPSLSVQQIEDLTTVAGHIACLATREKCLTADPSIEIDGVGARGTAETSVVAVNINPAA